MYVTKRFLIGVASCVALGLILSAATASVKPTYEDSPMTIPAGRYGDEFEYQYSERGERVISVSAQSGGVPWAYPASREAVAIKPKAAATSDDVQTWTDPVRVGTHIRDIEPHVDRTGQLRDALIVTSNRTGPTEADLVEYIDLGTRGKFRTDWRTSYGQGATTVYSSFATAPSQVRGFEYQGETIRLGQDVSHLYRRPAWVDPETDAFTLQSRVTHRALVDGQDAYVIESVYDFQEDARLPNPDGKPAPLIRTVELLYLSGDVPYPLLIQRHVTTFADAAGLGTQTTTVEERMHLVRYDPGTFQIPWGRHGRAPEDRDANPAIERSPGSLRYPADGTQSRLVYPLADAATSLQSDPTLVQFQRWRDANPGHRLVGYELHRGTPDASGTSNPRWLLVYAVEGGPAFAATTERTFNGLLVLNRELGARVVPKFTINDLPANPVTLTAAGDLWSAVSNDEHGDPPPNYVSWGFSRAGSQSNLVPLTRMTIGYTLPAAGARGAVASYMEVETDTGNVVNFYETRYNFGCTCIKTDLLERTPAVAPRTVLAGPTAPNIQEAAMTTSSVLAVFLAAYFLPLLKFLGAQGLALVPGYAKLRREEILENKVREQVLQHIRADPGVHASDLARRVEAGWGTIVYHLSVLEKNKLVSSLVDGRHKRFFPIGIIDFSRRGQLAVLKNETTKAIYHMIAEDPGVIQGTIAARRHLSVPAAIWHLRRLEDAGLVGRDKQGRKVHYFANVMEEAPPPYDVRDAVEVV